MPAARLAGIWTHWDEGGAGQDTLFLHCALAQGAAWRPLRAALPHRHHIAPDLPGHGQSGPRDDAQEPTDQALAMAAALLDQRPGPVDVIGHSLGAVIALRLALARPDRLRTLVLIEPVFFAAARVHAPAAFAAFAADTDAESAAFARGDWPRAARLFYDRWSGPDAWQNLSQTQRARIIAQIPLIPRTEPALVQDIHGILPRLAEVACPCLVLAGDRSPPIIPAIQQALVAHLPDGMAQVIEGAGHMLPLTHPGAVAAAIDRLPPGAQAPVSSGSIR